jgi:hypothetical protein
MMLCGGEPGDLLSAIRVVTAGECLLASCVTKRPIEAYIAKPAPRRDRRRPGRRNFERCPSIVGRVNTVISGRMNELPLADGLKAHIALRRDKGMKIINVWESEQDADAAMEMELPEFQEAMREAGVSPRRYAAGSTRW